MDISLPNNFPRVLELGDRHGLPLQDLLQSVAISDDETLDAVRLLDSQGYLADPYSALAWKALSDELSEGETGVFMCTAHPAKFRETLEEALNRPVPLPDELLEVADKEILSTVMPADFDLLRSFLLST